MASKPSPKVMIQVGLPASVLEGLDRSKKPEEALDELFRSAWGVAVSAVVAEANHTAISASTTIPTGGVPVMLQPTSGAADTRRRIRCVATAGADNLTFNFSLRKRS